MVGAYVSIRKYIGCEWLRPPPPKASSYTAAGVALDTPLEPRVVVALDMVPTIAAARIGQSMYKHR